MKLTRVPVNENTIRLNIALKESSAAQLKAYQDFYQHVTGQEIGVSALLEQMLKDFVRDDKTFQKFQAERKAANANVSAPVKAADFGDAAGDA